VKLYPVPTVVIVAALALTSISRGELSAQSAATTRLIELINAGDKPVDKELPRAAIDAGPPALPAIRNLLDRSTDDDLRLLALAAAVYIGGEAAIPLVRQEYTRQRDDAFSAALAAVLGSVDTPQNRRELIGMLSNDRGDWHTVQTAVFSLGFLRATEAVPALRIIAQPSNPRENDAATALKWIEKGYWAVGSSPDNEGGRAIAAVLRNGSPNITESDYVFDKDNGGFWKYGTSGWTFSKGEPADRTTAGPSIKSLVGSEGSRTLVSVDMYCGPLCGTGYTFVLRKEAGTWKVQMIVLDWIS
jgi:hypothetical protein